MIWSQSRMVIMCYGEIVLLTAAQINWLSNTLSHSLSLFVTSCSYTCTYPSAQQRLICYFVQDETYQSLGLFIIEELVGFKGLLILRVTLL